VITISTNLLDCQFFNSGLLSEKNFMDGSVDKIN